MKDRNSRQSFLGPNSDKILADSRIAVIGNCGGGSHVAQQLAHIGVGHFVLIDPDVTEEPNLNRMIGSVPADATSAKPKTEVIARLISSINAHAQIERFDCKWQECAIEIRACDIVFGCVDGFVTRSEIEAYSRRFLIPYIDVGMDVSQFEAHYLVSGQIITSLPGQPCMWCMGFLTEDLLAREAARYGDAGPRPQVIWPNGVLASIAVGNAIKLLIPWSREPVPPYIVYDGNRQTLAPSSRLAHVDLRGCKHYPPDQVGDPFWSQSD